MRVETIRHKILSYAKKIKSINLIGGECKNCGDKDIHKLCFHHRDKELKDIEINRAKYSRWSTLKEEVLKCDLLCHNCHLEHHFSLDSIDMSFKKNKSIFLEYIGVDSCQECGYNKCNAALHFHHNNNDKKFTISSVSFNYKSIDEVSDNILKEIDKCDVLCANCHYKKHIDVNFYEKYKNEIFNKVDNLRTCVPKIDRKLVHEMYIDKNMKQSEIVSYFGCDRSTISKIIKEIGDIKESTKSRVVKLYNSGIKKTEISKILNISYNTVKYHISKL